MFPLRPQTNRIRRSGRRDGVAAVELALTVPILFMLLFGALEFGRMNMIRETVNNAAYEAARACIVPGATSEEGEDAGRTVLRSIGVVGDVVDVQPTTITDTTRTVTATVTVPYGGNMWLAPLYSAGGSASVSCTLTRDWVVSTRSSR